MRYVKRYFGNNMTRPITGLLAGLMVIFLFLYPNVVVFTSAPLLILLGVVNIFGREMIELDFKNNLMVEYYQIIFPFSKSQRKLSDIDYILVRDFNTMNSHTIVGSDSGYYEMSFVRTKGPRIVLAFRESASGIGELVSEFERTCTYPIKDGTFSKILKRGQSI